MDPKTFLPVLCLFLSTLPAQTLWTVPSAATPTVQAAIDRARAGDTVRVLPGTYRENLDFKGKDILLTSFGDRQRTILDGGGRGPTITLVRGESRRARIEDLTITGGQGPYGGGLRVESSAPTLRRCILRGNTASVAGGAMGGKLGAVTMATSPLVEDCVFEANSTTLAAQSGGAAVGFVGALGLSPVPAPEFRRCIFRDNHGGERGGAVQFEFFGTPRFDRCIFARNSDSSKQAGEQVGGGALNIRLRTMVTATNCRFYGNSSKAAAVAKTYQGALVLRSCTLVGNQGGVGLLAAQPTRGRPMAASSIDAANCILSTNGSLELATSPVGYASLRVRSCLLTNGQTYDRGVGLGAGLIYGDPKLANPANWTHQLRPGSPCIDRGDDSLAVGLTTDMDGGPRRVGPRVDIGAAEFDPQAVQLFHDRGPISLTRPGSLNMRIDAGSARARMDAVLVPSLSGVLPGIDLWGQHLPLNLDGYSTALLQFGRLDAAGRWLLPFNLAPLQGNRALVGLELQWAAAVFQGGVLQRFSNSTYVRLVR